MYCAMLLLSQTDFGMVDAAKTHNVECRIKKFTRLGRKKRERERESMERKKLKSQLYEQATLSLYFGDR